ncbi:Alpha- and gamma-adaptin-binding protein p34 [Orchesella cincta]|uniref:Alpha-and gamma-adaptin-binding protein p34 n=1 Tax=Orchesella cincta TaxID=48709 RepID=A0A1D2MFN1_ORCCI|nr:Alpha- and gamma-adaptin-binding protein p34 [Orchesella cincta]
MKRVIQALGAHLWPNMVLKESTARVAPFRAFPNGVDGICRPMTTSNPTYSDNRLSDSFPDSRSLEHLPEHPIGTRTCKLVAAVKPIQQSPEREGGSNIAVVSPTLFHSQEVMQTDPETTEPAPPPPHEENLIGNPIPSGLPTASISPITNTESSSTTDETASSHQQVDPNAPAQARDERIDAVLEAMDSMSEETFEGLFQNLNQMKLKAQSLSPDQRRVYAEKMAIAFWKSIGGNDSELEGLSSDED